MTSEANKLKLLYLCQLFYEQTDEHHGVRMSEILDYLKDCGINAERKAIYRDIEQLRTFGLDIRLSAKGGKTYRLAKREFTLSELMLLTDAVQSSRFLTQSKCDSLVRSLKTLGSKEQVRSLNKRIAVQGRIKMQNESVFATVDRVQEAIRAHRKLSFKYYKYGVDKQPKLQHNGEPYVETPVHLIFSDGFYYCVCYNDRHECFVTYRIDRMLDLAVTDEPAARNDAIADFDASAYAERVFGMFNGEEVAVTLLVEEDAMSSVIDRFGKEVETYPVQDDELAGVPGEAPAAESNAAAVAEPTRARVHVRVVESPVFYGWLAQFGGKVAVEAPATVRENYRAFLQGIIAGM